MRVTTTPNGVAPAGSGTGDASNSVRLPSSTANALTIADPASTTYSVLPLGSSRASKGRRPVGSLNTVLPSSLNAPLPRILYLEIDGTAVLTVNRNRPSGVISTQHGAVCLSANGEAPMGLSTLLLATSYA